MYEVTRFECLLKQILDTEVYFKEMMMLNINAMTRIKHHRRKTINIASESSEVVTEEEDAKNAADDCEHEECHRVRCKYATQENDNRKESGSPNLEKQLGERAETEGYAPARSMLAR